MKTLLFFAIISIIPSLVTGQYQSGIQLEYGFAQGYFKDYNYSPLHYSETGHNIGLEFIRRKEGSRNLYRANLNPKLHSLNHREYDFLKSTLLGGDLSLSYERQLMSQGSNLEFFAGLGYGLDINFIDFLGLESYSWLFRHGLNAKTSTSYHLNDKHHFRGEFEVPLFHILNRPPYNGVDKYVIEHFENNLPAYALGGDLESWNKFGAATLDLEYLYNINRKWQATIGYRLDFKKVFDETNYTQLTNQYSIGIIYNL